MTEVKVFGKEKIVGFEISGHCTANYDDFEGKLVCSSVSSVAYLTANTILEIVGAKADVKINDEEGYMFFSLKSKFDESQVTLKGFLIHIEELAKQYRNYLKVYSEV